MSEREWQPGASDASATPDERANSEERAADARPAGEPGRTRGATDDARNVEGVQGGQGGTVERERPDGGRES